jgi:PKD repeat protein
MLCRDDLRISCARFCSLMFLCVSVFSTVILSFPRYLPAEESVCAVVKIEIKQEMTFERQAFDAHMAISNGLTTISLEKINVDVLFSDEQGETVRASSNPDDPDALFFIRIDTMEGIDDVAGSGTIAPATTGDIHWLIIPAPASVEDAPTGAFYFVGARLTYELGGEEYVTLVTPDFITVRPLPLLGLDYFLPDEVYGDDPFTIEEEPPIPFSLGVRISNNGHGTASDVKIDSAQPKIIDNEQGLTVDFLIEGSEVNGIAAPDTLLIQFGDIAPETSTIGRWLMSCSLSGRFTEFKAEYSHSNELGGELTSLLEDVETHFLVQDVLVDAPGRDTIRDFLGRDMDQFKVYESDTGITEVADLSEEVKVALVSEFGGIAKYSVEVSPTAGFFYLQFTDPQGGKKVVSEVIRSDGKMVRPENGWLSKKRVDEHWFYYANIFDFNSSGSYLFTLIDPSLAPQPPAFEEQENPVQKEGEEVSFIISLVDDAEPEVAGFSMMSVSRMALPATDTLDSKECDGKTEISAGRLPVGAKLIDRCDGTAILIWTPQDGQAGDYPLTFTATDGEFSTTVRYHLTVTDVDNTPTAQFSADMTTGEVPFPVLFFDNSLSEDGISSWFWDFGDGTTSRDQIPSHTYDVAGLYPVSLTVTEIDGDEHSVTLVDYITAENDRISAEFGHIAASLEWQPVYLEGHYNDPVVVATVSGGTSPGTYFTRIRDVLPAKFQVRVESSQAVAGENAGDISYIVVESGNHILQDGSTLYAQHLLYPTDGSELNHKFPVPFPQIPVVVATVASDNDLGVVTPALANITAEGFQLRLQPENENGLTRGEERIDCIGWEPGAGFIEGTVFEVGYLERVDEGWGQYIFAEQFATAPSFVAARQDRVDPAFAGAFFRSLDPFGVEARLLQTFSDSTTGSDIAEISPALAGYIAISSLSDTADSDSDGIIDLEERVKYGTHPGRGDSDLDGIGDYEELVYWDDRWDEDTDEDSLINLLDSDSDNDGFCDGLEIQHDFDPADATDFPASPIMETGRAKATEKWQMVGFNTTYLDPIVVATITESSGQVSDVRIRNISPESFEVRTTTESEEGISYIVMERSSYRLADGTLIVAGFTEAAPADNTVTLDFNDDFAVPPVVMVALTSNNIAEPLSVVLHSVSTENFVYSLQADQSAGNSLLGERIDFIGWEPSSGVAGDFTFETGYFDFISPWWQKYQFSRPLYGIQSFVAVLQEAPDYQSGHLLFENLNWAGIEARFARFLYGPFGIYGLNPNAGFIALSFIPLDLDSDGDGLTDRDEIQVYGTDPTLADSDGDGLGDGDEKARWDDAGDAWDGDIDNDGLLNILDIDSDNDGYNDGLEFVHGFDPTDPLDLPDGPIMISGDLYVDSEWQGVSFDRPYLDPVVVATPAGQAFSGNIIRIRDVGSTGFEIQSAGPGGSLSDATAVSYIVMERGIYTLPGGEKVIAEHSTTGAGPVYARHIFSNPFTTPPVIVASLIDGSETDLASIGLFDISPFMFYSALYDFTGHTSLKSSAGIDYIAWEPSAGETNTLYYSVSRFEKVNHKWKKYPFDWNFPTPPYLMTMSQDFDQFSPAAILARNISETDVEMRVMNYFESSKSSSNIKDLVGVMAITKKHE